MVGEECSFFFQNDVFGKDLTLALLNHRKHWTVAVIDPVERVITHYDTYMEYRLELEKSLHPHIHVSMQESVQG